PGAPAPPRAADGPPGGRGPRRVTCTIELPMSTRRLVFSCLFFVGCAAGVEDSGFGSFNMPTTTPTSGASSQSGDDSGDDTDASDTSGSGEGSDEESTADDTTTGPTTTTDPTNTTDPSTTGSDTMSDDD